MGGWLADRVRVVKPGGKESLEESANSVGLVVQVVLDRPHHPTAIPALEWLPPPVPPRPND